MRPSNDVMMGEGVKSNSAVRANASVVPQQLFLIFVLVSSRGRRQVFSQALFEACTCRVGREEVMPRCLHSPLQNKTRNDTRQSDPWYLRHHHHHFLLHLHCQPAETQSRRSLKTRSGPIDKMMPAKTALPEMFFFGVKTRTTKTILFGNLLTKSVPVTRFSG